MAERHFLDLNKKYGSVVAVDLVNQVSITAASFMLILLLSIHVPQQFAHYVYAKYLLLWLNMTL